MASEVQPRVPHSVQESSYSQLSYSGVPHEFTQSKDLCFDLLKDHWVTGSGVFPPGPRGSSRKESSVPRMPAEVEPSSECHY